LNEVVSEFLERREEVVTLTHAQARVLIVAARSDPELIPFHALALFAGIRPMASVLGTGEAVWALRPNYMLTSPNLSEKKLTVSASYGC
jgi:hypothetical protein